MVDMSQMSLFLSFLGLLSLAEASRQNTHSFAIVCLVVQIDAKKLVSNGW